MQTTLPGVQDRDRWIDVQDIYKYTGINMSDAF